METKEIDINTKKFVIKKLSYLDIMELSGILNKRERMSRLMELSGISKEDVEKLSPSEGFLVDKTIAEFSELNTDFRKLTKEDIK